MTTKRTLTALFGRAAPRGLARALVASGAVGVGVATALLGMGTALVGVAPALAAGSLAVTAASGTPQETALDTAFSVPLVATVSGLTPGSGCPSSVAFQAPAGGASATFAATGTSTDNPPPAAPAADATGDCSYQSSSLTANGSAGAYGVTASVAGAGAPATFSLANDGISASAGTPQTAGVGTTFPTSLVVAVFAGGAPVVGAAVTFSAPSSGATGAFSTTNTRSASAVTNAEGLATAPAFTADDTPGTYAVTATTSAVSGTATFTLTNSDAGVPSAVTATSGADQSAVVGTDYATPLGARVLDGNGNPVQGAPVTFSTGSGGGGASADFAGSGGSDTVATDSSGYAEAPPLQANDVAGTFTVTASVPGITGIARFTLTNLASAPATVTPGAGTSQEAAEGSTFPIPLSVTVTDAEGNPVPDAGVTFAAPASGASGTFTTTGTGTVTVVTDASGIAVAPAFRAGDVTGGYIVTASVAGVSPATSFALVNVASSQPDSSGPAPRTVGIAPTPTGGGYWLASSDGGVFSFGTAGFYGSVPGLGISLSDIVGVAATPTGKGYWEVASDGGIFTFGTAGFYGSMGGHHLNEPIVGMAAAPTGKGYWEVASDGGIFTFGAAGFSGSMGGHHLNEPIVGMAAAPTGKGYWEVASDGGIFTFGAAGFSGSMGGHHLNEPIVGMAATPTGKGYWLVASDGGIFTFGTAGFSGSVPGLGVSISDATSMAATPGGAGYRVADAGGQVFSL